MSDKKCLLCGLIIGEGRQICILCERSLTPYTEQLRAAFNRDPVEFRGNKYGCISAFVIRFRSEVQKPLKRRCILQFELMSATAQSVTVADPNEVTVLKEYQK